MKYAVQHFVDLQADGVADKIEEWLEEAGVPVRLINCRCVIVPPKTLSAPNAVILHDIVIDLCKALVVDKDNLRPPVIQAIDRLYELIQKGHHIFPSLRHCGTCRRADPGFHMACEGYSHYNKPCSGYVPVQ